jgi:hypothetical protein
VRQGAIVENKLLGHTLTVIRELQNLRDENTFNSRPLTLREEDFLRRSMGESGRPHRRPRKKQPRRRGPSYAQAHDAIATEVTACALH